MQSPLLLDFFSFFQLKDNILSKNKNKKFNIKILILRHCVQSVEKTDILKSSLLRLSTI